MLKYNKYSWYNDVIVKNIKTGKKDKRTVSKQIIRRQNLKAGDHLNSEEIIIKIFGKVGVKKKLSKPYLEIKVVKVKKKSNCCPTCGREVEKPKGNWVNGENLDKIKFPCFCSYMDGEAKKTGMLNRVFFREEYFYVITDCSQQYVDSNGEQFYHPSNLKTMFERYKIHILKGKIIIYEDK